MFAAEQAEIHPEGRAMLAQPLLRYGHGVEVSGLPGDAGSLMISIPRDSEGRADVRQLIEAQDWRGLQPLVIVVAEDLHSAGCASLFGFADPAACVAVVSTFRLGGDGDLRLRERLSKVIAHEWMHLAGRRHCKHPGCLMHPVASVDELDARGEALCDRCRRVRNSGVRWPWKGIAAAVAVVIALSGGMDLTVKALQTKSTPFYAQDEGTVAAVLYQGEEVLRIPATGSGGDTASQRARALSNELNRLFAEIDPPFLQAHPQGASALVLAAGRPILTVDAAIAGTQSPEAFARGWTAKWNPLLQAKGRPHESCPDCHIRRRAQVRETVARPPRFWR
jgi:hypothetical protein